MPQQFQYDNDYFYNMLRMYSPSAKQICEARWKFVEEINADTVLDYGSGCGFFKAFAPEGVKVDTFDIMRVPQTGVTRNQYDLVTFWDVLEHIPDLPGMKSIFEKTNYVALTVPIKPDNVSWEEYKHFKPGEHIHHFQEDYLRAVMKTVFGFDIIKIGTPECPPRSMISSFLCKRKETV